MKKKLLLGQSVAPALEIRLAPNFGQFDLGRYETAKLAAAWRNWQVLDKSLSLGVKLSSLAADDMLAAFNIAKSVPMSVLEKAVNAKFDLNAVSQGDAPVWLSLLWFGDIERLKFVLEHGANANGAAAIGSGRKSPLHFIFDVIGTHGNVEARVALLLAHGANPTLLFQGESPCSLAVKKPEAGLRKAFEDACNSIVTVAPKLKD